jgi:hypothetical protein
LRRALSTQKGGEILPRHSFRKYTQLYKQNNKCP